tara:strand:+ start:78 stop:1229 length:1152 start_codon:yes stop_codon:yes gene_type:complete
LNSNSLPEYSVRELNEAISSLLDRGFAPLFVLKANISKCQLKKGHIWITFSDGNSSIDGVIWSSRLKKIKYEPKQDDGVLVIGKLNFWLNQARLSVQVIDLRPSNSTVLRQFELVKNKLMKEGLIDFQKRKNLPKYPKAIALLTSVPSSALADMLRTAKERWPLTKLVIIPIPVQGGELAAKKIQETIKILAYNYQRLEIDAIIIARGGGNRDDLMLFDNENICRELANFPLPVITGIGHEDDLTVADLVVDYRSATPTASIVDILPTREIAKNQCLQEKYRLKEYTSFFINKEKQNLNNLKAAINSENPLICIDRKRKNLMQYLSLIDAFSPSRWLKRGFSILTNKSGEPIRSIKEVDTKKNLNIELYDGYINAKTQSIKIK